MQVFVIPNTDSVKIRVTPFPGAKDYRVFDAANPGRVKYAGQHFFLPPAGKTVMPNGTLLPTGGAKFLAAPALEIEWNGLTPGVPTTLIIQPVNMLGPVCYCSLSDVNNNALFPMTDPDAMLGINAGCTFDGKTSINGQGDVHNDPQALASVSIIVTATGKPALPSTPQVVGNVVFDTFPPGSTITPVGKPDPRAGIALFSLVTPSVTWEVRTENIDTTTSSIMLSDSHLMDTIYDGGTPHSGNPLHQGHGVISFSPVPTADITAGKILHITAEVDAHLTNVIRRWIDFRIVPASDPYLALETQGRINKSNTDVMIQVFGNIATVDQRYGDKQPGAQNSPPLSVRIVGAAGQGMYADCNRPGWAQDGTLIPGNPVYQAGANIRPYQQGRGIDNRSRFDLFVSQTRFALYEDGVKITEHDFAHPLTFGLAKVYLSHYMYHSALGVQEIANTAPWESYWIKTFPYSDERHWSGCGWQVLPASMTFATLRALLPFQSYVPAPVTVPIPTP